MSSVEDKSWNKIFEDVVDKECDFLEYLKNKFSVVKWKVVHKRNWKFWLFRSS